MTDPTPVARPWRVFAATSIGVFAVFVNISGLTVALPTITRELEATSAQATTFVLAYMLVTTALLLVFGRLADLVGRRPLYLAGLGLFTAATALCALSVAPWMLIAARVLQGVGAAACITNNTALLTDTFPPERLGQALGWNATVAAVAQVAGPVLGGVATWALGWRGLFLLCLPIGVIALVASLAVVPRRPRPRGRREGFDAAGAVLSGLALSAAVLALTPALPGPVWLPPAAGATAVVSAAVFVLVQVRRAHPLVDIRLFADRSITLVLVAVLLNAVATYAVVILVSLYAQGGGFDPVRAGATVVPVAVGTVAAASAAGMLLRRFTPRTLTATGMALNALGLIGTTLVLTDDASGLATLVPWLTLLGAGTGLFMTPGTTALMLGAPAERRGVANGLRSTVQNVGYLFSAALALAVATAGLGDEARRAALGGTLAAVSPAELARFVDNLRMTGAAFAVIATLGVAVCLMFPRRTPLPPLVVAERASESSVHR